MPYSVIVCDDSRLARQQLIRSLPAGLTEDILTASHGDEALQYLREGRGDLLFLDLNMPGKDGYQVLEAIRNEGLNSLVFVVSGDIQPQAMQRIKDLGALAFLQKPLKPVELNRQLALYGLLPTAGAQQTQIKSIQAESGMLTHQESLQEVVNVAMGQAARQLADLLNLFIHLPIPRVQQQSTQAILHELENWQQDGDDRITSQGFVGDHIAGECLVHFRQQDLNRIGPLLGFTDQDDLDHQSLQIELSSMLSGTLLLGLAEQLGLRLSRSHPTLVDLGGDSLRLHDDRAEQVLTVKLAYSIPSEDIRCTLLLMFTPQSLSPLTRRLNLIAG